MNKQEENAFIRKYFDTYKPKHRNCLIHDNNTGESHRRLVADIFEWSIKNGLVVYTKVYLKGGEVADIVIPELSRPFIEVRSSELKIDKEYLSDLDELRQFVDVSDPYKLL